MTSVGPPTPKRQVFFSFNFAEDFFRAGQVRNIGAIEGNPHVSDNDWEAVKRGGDQAIRRWIDDQMKYRSCTIVLIGANTAGRRWINYEIKKSWQDGKGLLGIHIHKLKNEHQRQTVKGPNPFDSIRDIVTGQPLSQLVNTYEPTDRASKDVYACIRNNIVNWIEAANQ